MINFQEKEIKEAFEKSNLVIKEILLDSWITNDVSLIGKNFNIRLDRIDILIRIVGYITLNLIPLSKLIEVIEVETEMDKKKATEVAKKIDEIVFTKIRRKVKDASLLKEKENSSVSEKEEEDSFSNILEKNKSTQKVKKVIDPYREIF